MFSARVQIIVCLLGVISDRRPQAPGAALLFIKLLVDVDQAHRRSTAFENNVHLVNIACCALTSDMQ